jgi:hypothetical protein
MVDATKSFDPGRELITLGRADVPVPIAARSRTRESVASII